MQPDRRTCGIPRAAVLRRAAGLAIALVLGTWVPHAPAFQAPRDQAAGRGRASCGASAADAEPVGAVDDDDLLKAGGNHSNWLMYGRTYDAQRYSPLKQINRENVARLVPAWTFQTGVLDGFECSPLIIDGIMYLDDPGVNHGVRRRLQDRLAALALPEVAAGEPRALLRRRQPRVRRLGRPPLHAHPRRPPRLPRPQHRRGDHRIPGSRSPGEGGKEVGDIYKMAYSATVAPLVIKDKVIMGISGAEYGIRGFIDAYNAKTGKRVWRFHTVPSPDDKSDHARKALATWEGNLRGLTGGGSGSGSPARTTRPQHLSTGAWATPRPTSTATSARGTTSTPAPSSPSTPTTAHTSGTSRTAPTTSGITTA